MRSLGPRLSLSVTLSVGIAQGRVGSSAGLAVAWLVWPVPVRLGAAAGLGVWVPGAGLVRGPSRPADVRASGVPPARWMSAAGRVLACPGAGARGMVPRSPRLDEALAPHGHPRWQRRSRRCCGGERDAPDHRGRDHEGPDRAGAHRRADQARLARAAGQGRRALRPLRLPRLLPGLRPWPIRAGNPLRGERAVAGLVLAGASRPARMMKPVRAVRASRDAAGTGDRARRHGPGAQGAGSRPAEGGSDG